MITNMLAHMTVNKCPFLNTLRTKILSPFAFTGVPHASPAGHIRIFRLATYL